jgi:hypothetical protein
LVDRQTFLASAPWRRARGAVTCALLTLPAGARLLRDAKAVGRLVLSSKRRARHPLKAIERRVDPKAPARKASKWHVLTDHRGAQSQFISACTLAARCGRVFHHEGDLVVNPERKNDWIFVTTDDVEYFFNRFAPDREFLLVSGYSDRPIDRGLRRFARDARVRRWLATNVIVGDPKLIPIPLGVRDPYWASHDLLRDVSRQRLSKKKMFHVEFDPEQNPLERYYCLDQTGLALAPAKTWEAYLRDLAQSFFCISPKGRGIDCHRTWEALYLGTVPVVTRSRLTEHHTGLPMIVLDDWCQFRSIRFSAELYNEVCGEWKSCELEIDRYLGRLDLEPETNSVRARRRVST